MATSADINELFERYTRIENEMKLLQDDKKQLFAEFKDKVDPKAFQAALQKQVLKQAREEKKSWENCFKVRPALK